MLKKIKYNSPVILTFTLLSLMSLVLGYITNDFTTDLLFTVYRDSPLNPLFYIRIFSYVLGHADLEHFFGNFITILLLGPMIEEKYGSKNMILMILFTAFITSIINLAFVNTGLLGASGIVFMLIMLSSFVNFNKGEIPLTFILIVILYFTDEIMRGFTMTDNISQLAHIIGGICGGLFGYWLNTSKKRF